MSPRWPYCNLLCKFWDGIFEFVPLMTMELVNSMLLQCEFFCFIQLLKQVVHHGKVQSEQNMIWWKQRDTILCKVNWWSTKAKYTSFSKELRLKKVQCNYRVGDYDDKSSDFISFIELSPKIVPIYRTNSKYKTSKNSKRGWESRLQNICWGSWESRLQNICWGSCIMIYEFILLGLLTCSCTFMLKY
jgi:hypothetical protein